VVNFSDRLIDAIERKRSRLCVGLDPRVEFVPASMREAAVASHGETADAVARMFVDFNRAIIDVVAPLVPAVKPQIAFYEAFGPAGLRAFAETAAYAAERGLLVIGDVKRSDIGSTAKAYAAAFLGRPPGEGAPSPPGPPFPCDAITVVPYLGGEGVEPFIRAAAAHGRGLFVLVRTSNPSAREVQDIRGEGGPLFHRVAERVDAWGAELVGESGYSSVGAVVGATYPDDIPALRRRMPRAFFLLPGYGAQGATAADVAGAFDDDGLGGLVTSSRGIIAAHLKEVDTDWQDAIRAATERANADLDAHLPPLTEGPPH
jgi:orotidine-5'-phosphate decarboxylase